jgi:hypothetical protein
MPELLDYGKHLHLEASAPNAFPNLRQSLTASCILILKLQPETRTQQRHARHGQRDRKGKGGYHMQVALL